MGRNEPGPAGNPGTWNWSKPESFAFDAPAGSHLFLVAWDTDLWQMVAGEFAVAGEEPVATSATTWQCVFTQNNNPGEPGSLPGISALTTQIQSASWQPPLAAAPQGTEPWGAIPGLSPAATFIWPDTLDQASSSDSGYVIFRTTQPAVPFPTASATITADNHYALYTGAADGQNLSFIGRNEAGHAGDPGTWNWSLPEPWGFTPDVGDHLYVVAWDDGGPQSWIGQVALPDGSTLVSNTQEWEYVLGDGSNPGADGQAPSKDALRTRISAAVWADIGAATGNGSAPWGAIPGIGSAANFIWHDTLADSSASDSSYAIYRTKKPVLACDLDVDSDNTGVLHRSLHEENIEDRTDLPGVIVPVGSDKRVPMVVQVLAGQTATLEITQGADKVRVYGQETGGAPILGPGQLSTPVVGDSPQTFWIEAVAASTSLADIAFTVTVSSSDLASSDIVRATAVEADLDIDSDNDNRLDSPCRNDKEEQLEANTPKRVVVNDNDTDGDLVPDYADWSIAGKRFTPMVVQIPASLPLASIQLNVSYAASDPALVGTDHRLPIDSAARQLRLWTRNAGEARNTASVTAGGSFVPAGRIADLSTLGFTDSTRTVELYVEGIQATAGISRQISIELIVGDRVAATDLVTVVVVSNTLVIGIDGTGSEAWLSKEVHGRRINERNTQDGTRWNSHVRNLIADNWAFAMTIYSPGPVQDWLGDTSAAVFRAARDQARNMITDAGGDTTIALVGWSRGAMIASGVAHALLNLADGDLPRTVAFIGMFDPVDMSNGIDHAWATIHADVQAVTIVGPTADGQTRDEFNVDYPVSGYRGFDNWTFERMALGNRITTADGAAAVPRRIFYNASHGALGGTPGYNRRHRDGGNFPENYDYTLDVRDSILADKDVRAGMRVAGLKFVPDRDEAWYGFPAQRPPEEHRE